MAFNGKNRRKLRCGVATCGRLGVYNLKNKFGHKPTKSMCKACHRAYEMGKSHERQKSTYKSQLKKVF